MTTATDASPYDAWVGEVFLDTDVRMGGRKVKIASVFFNAKKNGRLYAKTWYARCARVSLHGDREPNLTISCERLAASSAYRIVSSDLPV